jgi:hypothetical protein
VLTQLSIVREGGEGVESGKGAYSRLLGHLAEDLEEHDVLVTILLAHLDEVRVYHLPAQCSPVFAYQKPVRTSLAQHTKDNTVPRRG